MKTVIVLNTRDWGNDAVYYKGKLVGEELGGDKPLLKLMYMLDMAHEFGFTREDVSYHMLTEDDNEKYKKHGFFFKDINDYKCDYYNKKSVFDYKLKEKKNESRW